MECPKCHQKLHTFKINVIDSLSSKTTWHKGRLRFQSAPSFFWYRLDRMRNISKGGRLAVKVTQRWKDKRQITSTSSLKRSHLDPNHSQHLKPAVRQRLPDALFQRQGGGLITHFLQELIYAIRKDAGCCCGRHKTISIHIIFFGRYVETVSDLLSFWLQISSGSRSSCVNGTGVDVSVSCVGCGRQTAWPPLTLESV